MHYYQRNNWKFWNRAEGAKPCGYFQRKTKDFMHLNAMFADFWGMAPCPPPPPVCAGTNY